MSTLLERLQSAGSIKTAEIVSESSYFNERDVIPVSVPIINVAFSGRLDGGFVPGLTVLAGDSKTFKTLLSLKLLKSYLDKYDDSIAVIYDIEKGITLENMKMHEIDTDRVLLIRDIEHVEQLKFDMHKRLTECKKGDHVFFLIDSIGMIASKKEIDDSIEEKSVADMTRAKAIRSFLRIITPHLTIKDLPCVMIAHTYNTMELYAKAVVSGGTAITYTANQVFIITRAQEKDSDKELVGWNFTIHVDKSRFVKDKAKFTFTVLFDYGIEKNSGILDLAVEGGFVTKSGAWYAYQEQKFQRKQSQAEDFWLWEKLYADKGFHKFIEEKYRLGYGKDNSVED